MSNQSPCTDPPYPCTTLTLAEKNYALEGLVRLRKYMLLAGYSESDALDAAIRALRKAATVDDCRVRKIPVYGMGRADGAEDAQRGGNQDMPEDAAETVEDAQHPPKVPPKKRSGGWRC